MRIRANVCLGLMALPSAVCLMALPSAAWAHKPSDSYLSLRPAGGVLEARWDLAVRDLDHALGLDGDGDGAVTWGEVRVREPAITDYALSRVTLAAGGADCRATAGALATVSHSDGAYLSLPISFACPPGALGIDYRLFRELDPQHRGLLRLEDDETLVLDPAEGARALPLRGTGPQPSALAGFFGFVGQGVTHIWGGLDHVLFLIALLLPSVLRREQEATTSRWVPVAEIRPALVDVAKIVTAFTAAHSLTLSLAALGVVSVPARVVEPAIAASVALAAANNVRPIFGADRWVVAFALGLLHGFGFSSVLADLGLAHANLVRSLVGFNAGVEVGQLAIVAVFVPLAFLLRRRAGYRRVALVGGSLAIAGLSVVWIVERIATG
jgi:hypothetical protein